MNLNHDPDKHLLDQIDKLLETNQLSGDKVLDELATTRPTLRPAFQNALEERLLARFEQNTQGENPMLASRSYLSITAPRRNWLPLTLFAALLVVAIAGVMLINGKGKSPTPNEMALAPATSTATVTVTPTGSIVPPVVSQNLRIPGVGGVVPIVIAVKNIPRGTVLSSQWLSVIYSGGDSIDQTYTDPELLRGLVANQDIPRWQPILPSYLTDQPVSTTQATDLPSPNVNVVVAFQNLPRGYTFSDRDLSNVAGYAGWPANEVPDGAIRDNDNSNITMLEGKTLQQNVPRGQPILSSMLEGELQPTRSNVGIHSPTDRVAVAVPLTALTTDSLVPGVGGSVDIVALLPFKSANQNVNAIPATFMPDGSRIVETMLIRDTIVLFHGSWPQTNATDTPSNITFAVTPQDSRILAWLAEQPQVTFRLQKPLTNVFDLPADTRMIEIPFDNVAAEENIQPGDKVDVYSTCSLVPDVMGINNTVVTSKTDCTQEQDEKRASNATVFIGEIVINGRPSVMTYQSITLAVMPDTVPLFTQLIGAGMHFKLVKSGAVSQPTATELPTSGSYIVDIPRDHIIFNDRDISRGDSVDITAICAFVPETPDANNVLVPAKVDCSQKTETAVVSEGLVLFTASFSDNGNTSTISVAVLSSQKTQLLQMIAAGMVFKLVKSTGSGQPALTFISRAGDKISISIMLSTIGSINSEGLQIGDRVDVSAGQIAQVVARNALITQLNNDSITLELSLDEATAINQAVNTNLKLRVKKRI